MHRLSLLAILAVSVPSLAGCKVVVISDLYTSDLIAAAEGEQLTVPTLIQVEVSSARDCEENAAGFKEALETQFQGIEFIGCTKTGFDDLSQFRIQVPVVENSGLQTSPLAISAEESGGVVAVKFLSNPKSVRAIWDALPEEATRYNSFDVEPVLSVTLNNDLGSNVVVTTDDSFVDGTAIQGTEQRTLGRRGQVVVRMSDVTNAAFSVESVSSILKFTVPTE